MTSMNTNQEEAVSCGAQCRTIPGYGNPNTKYVVPAVTNTYCLPSTAYVTGFDRSEDPR